MTDQTTTTTEPRDPGRRQALRLLAGGVAAIAAAACTPARIVLQAYPEEYRRESDATDTALLAFIDTVIPGLTLEERRAVGALNDPFYPMARYSAFLASDLDRRSQRAHHQKFAALPPAQRAGILTAALDSRDKTTRRLYTGAVFLTEAAVYGGFQDDRAGCRLSGFPGGYKIIPRTEVEPRMSSRLAAWAGSPDGNPA